MRNVDHIVLERGKIGEGWRRRWDSFCLVTPNWSVQLPGFPYDGPDPDGFMLRDEIVGYLNRYASSFGCPVREGIEVTSVAGGTFQCHNLVLATGAFQRPHLPAGAETFPSRVHVINLGEYHNPAALPDGAVLIIGSGQSGASWRKNCTRPAAAWSCPAAALRGRRDAPATAILSGGRSNPGFSTRPAKACRRKHG